MGSIFPYSQDNLNGLVTWHVPVVFNANVTLTGGLFNQLQIGNDQFAGTFGQTNLLVGNAVGNNAIVGQVTNTLPNGTLAFPTGVSGVGSLPATSGGNTVFGLYGLNIIASPTGVATSEITARNNTLVDASTALPPDESIGTAQKVSNGLQITSGGTANNSIGLTITREGGSSKDWNTAQYINSYKQFGLFIDSSVAGGTPTGVYVKSLSNAIGMQVQSAAAGADNSTLLEIDDNAGFVFGVRSNGKPIFSKTQTTIGAAGGASALPATPVGYLQIQVGGVNFAVPYYNP